MSSETPKSENFEIKKNTTYMDNKFDIIFKIDSNSELEVLCISENGISFISEKFNIKNSNLKFDLFTELIEFEENWKLEGDFREKDFSITIFKIIKLNFNMVSSVENSEKIIQYLCKKVYELSKEVSLLKEKEKNPENNNIKIIEKNPENNDIKIIPLKLANGWSDYGSGYSPGRIIKKGNEITLSGLLAGSNFSTICVLPEDCRPKQRLIFTLNHNEYIMRFDILPDGSLQYCAGQNSYNWISLDGIHFFAGI